MKFRVALRFVRYIAVDQFCAGLLWLIPFLFRGIVAGLGFLAGWCAVALILNR